MSDHPTPVQGEALPVVALKRYVTGFEHGTWFCREDAEGNWCDYQEATAEIVHKDEYIVQLECAVNNLRTQLSTALAESGELATGLRACQRHMLRLLPQDNSPVEEWREYNKSFDEANALAIKLLARHTTTQDSKPADPVL